MSGGAERILIWTLLVMPGRFDMRVQEWVIGYDQDRS